jgi:hypothetical protein
MTETTPFSRAARWTRFTLLAAIAAVLGLIVTTPRNEYPLTMSRAQANAISAAPGFLLTSLTAGNANQFYIVDTTKQIICVYNVTGDQLRLEAARKFDYDTEIWDSSVAAKGIRIEGNTNGIGRDDAKAYWEEIKPKIEALLEKKKK